MAYTKTVWKDRIVERPMTFQMQNNSDGTVTLIPKEGQVIEAGTPIIATNMNNIEAGIQETFQRGIEVKQGYVDALNSKKGIIASTSMTHEQLMQLVRSIAQGQGNAQPWQVLSGITFTNDTGVLMTGTMPNRGSVTITPSTTNQAIANGYHNGSGIVSGDSDLLAINIKSGVNIFGVNGAYDGDIITGKTSYTFPVQISGKNLTAFENILTINIPRKPKMVYLYSNMFPYNYNGMVTQANYEFSNMYAEDRVHAGIFYYGFGSSSVAQYNNAILKPDTIDYDKLFKYTGTTLAVGICCKVDSSYKTLCGTIEFDYKIIY